MQSRTGELALTAAVGFVAGALLANPARKLAMQGAEAMMTRDWLDALTKEHRAVQKSMEQLLQTTEKDTMRRGLIIASIDHALTKHALQEEKVIYPALRRVDEERAQRLFADHADVKSLISELQFEIPKDSPAWIERARKLQNELNEHIQEEETDILLSFKNRLTEQENAELTKNMHMQGFMVA
jgi:hemerythrin superfamily protein